MHGARPNNFSGRLLFGQLDAGGDAATRVFFEIQLTVRVVVADQAIDDAVLAGGIGGLVRMRAALDRVARERRRVC